MCNDGPPFPVRFRQRRDCNQNEILSAGEMWYHEGKRAARTGGKTGRNPEVAPCFPELFGFAT